MRVSFSAADAPSTLAYARSSIYTIRFSPSDREPSSVLPPPLATMDSLWFPPTSDPFLPTLGQASSTANLLPSFVSASHETHWPPACPNIGGPGSNPARGPITPVSMPGQQLDLDTGSAEWSASSFASGLLCTTASEPLEPLPAMTPLMRCDPLTAPLITSTSYRTPSEPVASALSFAVQSASTGPLQRSQAPNQHQRTINSPYGRALRSERVSPTSTPDGKADSLDLRTGPPISTVETAGVSSAHVPPAPNQSWSNSLARPRITSTIASPHVLAVTAAAPSGLPPTPVATDESQQIPASCAAPLGQAPEISPPLPSPSGLFPAAKQPDASLLNNQARAGHNDCQRYSMKVTASSGKAQCLSYPSTGLALIDERAPLLQNRVHYDLRPIQSSACGSFLRVVLPDPMASACNSVGVLEPGDFDRPGKIYMAPIPSRRVKLAEHLLDGLLQHTLPLTGGKRAFVLQSVAEWDELKEELIASGPLKTDRIWERTVVAKNRWDEHVEYSTCLTCCRSRDSAPFVGHSQPRTAPILSAITNELSGPSLSSGLAPSSCLGSSSGSLANLSPSSVQIVAKRCICRTRVTAKVRSDRCGVLVSVTDRRRQCTAPTDRKQRAMVSKFIHQLASDRRDTTQVQAVIRTVLSSPLLRDSDRHYYTEWLASARYSQVLRAALVRKSRAG